MKHDNPPCNDAYVGGTDQKYIQTKYAALIVVNIGQKTTRAA
jgi:hypothetical protein